MRHFVLMLALGTFTAGCGGWSVTSAQRSLHVGSEGVQAIDEQLAPIVTSAIDRCNQEHADREGFLECVEPYHPIRYGVSLGRRSLRIGQATVDAWRTGESEGADAWMPIAACLGHAFGEVAGAVRELELELEVPEVLGSILAWVDAFGALVSGICPAELLEADGE